MDPGKLDLARRLYVFDYKSLSEICLMLDISMFLLSDTARDDKWDNQRSKNKEKRKSEEDNSLALHSYLTSKALRNIDVLLTRQGDNSLDPNERRNLRSESETALAMNQALSAAIDSDRRAHGVPNKAPSVAHDSEEVQGVRYFVGLPNDPSKVGEVS